MIRGSDVFVGHLQRLCVRFEVRRGQVTLNRDKYSRTDTYCVLHGKSFHNLYCHKYIEVLKSANMSFTLYGIQSILSIK